MDRYVAQFFYNNRGWGTITENQIDIIIRHATTRGVRGWFSVLPAEYCDKYVPILIKFLSLEEIMSKFNKGKPNWWDYRFNYYERCSANGILGALKPDELTVEVHMWNLNNNYEIFLRRLPYFDRLIQHMLNLSPEDKRRLVDYYIETESDALFFAPLEFKLALGLPYDGHPHWLKHLSTIWDSESMDQVWKEWCKEHTITQVRYDVYLSQSVYHTYRYTLRPDLKFGFDREVFTNGDDYHIRACMGSKEGKYTNLCGADCFKK